MHYLKSMYLQNMRERTTNEDYFHGHETYLMKNILFGPTCVHKGQAAVGHEDPSIINDCVCNQSES